LKSTNSPTQIVPYRRALPSLIEPIHLHESMAVDPSTITPVLREHHVIAPKPWDILISRTGNRPPSSHERMISLLTEGVPNWCRDNLSGPVEGVEFTAQVATPSYYAHCTTRQTVQAVGYAVEFSSLNDAVFFKLRWF
jgi:hypothetical protein